MIEFTLFVVFLYAIYFWVIPRINQEKIRLTKTQSTFRVNELLVKFGEVSTIKPEFGAQSELGYFVSAIKPWARGPLEIMFTSTLMEEQIIAAIEAIDSNAESIHLNRFKVHFDGDRLIKSELKKSFFYISINYDVEDAKPKFREALSRLRGDGA